MTEKRVLFICRHNSGRSQMAEAYLRKFAQGRLHVESAGFDPADKVHPLVIAVMKEEGIDLTEKKPRKVFDLYRQGRLFDHVITVCDDSEGECPVFPGITRRWSHPFPDPAAVTGTPREQLARVREIRDMIKNWLLDPPAEGFSFHAVLAENEGLNESEW